MGEIEQNQQALANAQKAASQAIETRLNSIRTTGSSGLMPLLNQKASEMWLRTQEAGYHPAGQTGSNQTDTLSTLWGSGKPAQNRAQALDAEVAKAQKFYDDGQKPVQAPVNTQP